MKYLLVLVVVMVAIWVWRSNRAGDRSEETRRARPKDTDAAVDMLGCDVCGVHCPREDAIVGRKGVYCCAQHRNQAEA